jgi:hypothetical protein
MGSPPRTLYQCLLDAGVVRLRVIARYWDLELASTRRRKAAAQLAEWMADADAVADALQVLPDDQRRALEALLAAGGQAPLRVFGRGWGEIRNIGPGRMEREEPWREPVSPLEGLWYRGLVARAFEQGEEEAYEVVFIPAELRAHLKIPAARPPAIALAPSPAPTHVRAAGDALLDDGCTLLAYLQNEHVRPGAGGGWPARHERQLGRRLRDPSPARLAFLRHLAHRLGWLRTADSGHLRPDPEPATGWLQSSTNEQRRALFEAWRDDPAWNDLFHVPTLRPEDTGAWHNDTVLARRAILHHLGACREDTWYALDAFAGAVKQADPDFCRPGGDYTTWYIRHAVTGAFLSGFESWDDVEGALVRYLLDSPLHWLGIVDLGSPAAGAGPNAFRLTPAGAAFAGPAAPPPEPDGGPFDLREDLAIVAPPPRRYERFQLERVADRVVSPQGREAQIDAFVYRLTPSSLERARRQGIPVERVREFLGRVTARDVPRPVEEALARWDEHGAEARLDRVVLLRVAGESLMEQVLSSPATRKLIQERVGPAAALVRERDRPRLAAALGRMGLLTDVTGAEEAERDTR